jgi:hypothetical protein
MATDKRNSSADQPPTGSPVAALDGALDALQGMLERQRVVPPGAGAEDGGPDDDLPVLDQVVIPGAGAAAPRPIATGAPREPTTEPLWATPPPALPAHDDLVKRLTSEVEVIIEEALAEALARARKEIRARVSQHLDIVLPEVLEELVTRSRGRT